jgi:hypothetical protein
VIQDLLWRCPLCSTNDALRQVKRLFSSQAVNCSHCGGKWLMRRKVGDDYYLRLVKVGHNGSSHPSGVEFSVADWYGLMKQTVHLQALPDAQGLLEVDEILYLLSKPTFFWMESHQDHSETKHLRSIFEHGNILPETNLKDCTKSKSSPAETGRFFLTNQRFIWQRVPDKSDPWNFSSDSDIFSLPLNEVNGVYLLLNYGLTIVEGMKVYYLRFTNESPLKWITYVDMVSRQLNSLRGHPIHTSHY